MVLPLKDTMPGARLPVATRAHRAPGARRFAAAAEGGWLGPGGALHAGLTLLALWIFGATLEDALGRSAFVVLAVLGGAGACAVVLATGASAPGIVVAAAGAVATVLGAYVALSPRGRVLCAALVPLAFTMLEAPAVVLVALWAVAQAAILAPAGLAAVAAPAAGFVLGPAAARLLARPRPVAPAPYRVA